jgi:hypothetical protein
MRLCLALLILLGAPTWAAAPEPSPDELRFITANAEFTLLHEMGHLLISELQLPVLGREEDAADQLGFMGLFLLYGQQADADFYARLLDVADYWRLEAERTRGSAEQIPLWDSHSLDEQRFFNIACLAYGSDPQRLEWIVESTGLPEERALYCDREYAQVHHAVNWLLERFQRPADRPARGRIEVIYDEPPVSLANAREMQAAIRASGELERVASRASAGFELPRDLTLRVSTCGTPDAWFNSVSGELTLCYELLGHFHELARGLPDLKRSRSD